MTESPHPAAPPSRNLLLALLLIPAATALAFTLYTHEIWEDFFITFRHTENLVQGRGLVYNPGERVHGFTSVLNTLVPALPLWIFGSLRAALLVYRICSLATLLGGLAVLWRNLARRQGSGRWELLFIAVLVATSVKIVAFTMNGQEAGFLVGFLSMALGIALRFDEPRAWRPMGLVWAGLLYTRPDSPLYIALVAGIAWSVYPGGLRPFFLSVLKAAVLAAVCYAPWLTWAWVYYGSPVPHTVVAKAADSFFVNDNGLATFEAVWSRFVEIVGDVFGPIYGLGGWPELLGWGATLGGLATAFFWLIPVKDRFARSCSFALLVVLVYLACLRVQRDAYPWYFGPASLLGSLVAARYATIAWSQRARWGRIAGGVGAGALIATCATCFFLSNVQLRILQVEIENNTRKPIGLWLRDHVAPGDTVFLEPIGYIGYYSGAKILDYPGLVSPAVVKARRETQAGFAELPPMLKPTWIVARQDEVAELKTVAANVSAYDWVQVFDAGPALDKYGPFAGELTLRHDSWFVVLHRKPGID